MDLDLNRVLELQNLGNDDTMSDADPAAVPTEFATESFPRRLHFDRGGVLYKLQEQLVLVWLQEMEQHQQVI